MNFSIGNIVIALILGAIGAWFVIKAFYINHQIFTLGWAEHKWGPGSGTTAYKIIGLALLILSFFVIPFLFSDSDIFEKIKNNNNLFPREIENIFF